MCYLCGCIVANCGGVTLQVAGRLTQLHRKTVKRNDGGMSINVSYQILTQEINLNSDVADFSIHTHTYTALPVRLIVLSVWLISCVCMAMWLHSTW